MRVGVPMESDASTGEIDLAHVGRAVARKRWWVVGPTLAAFAGALIFVNIVKPRYTSDVRLLLENQDKFFTRVDKGERVDAQEPDAEGVQSQIQLLTSRDLARRVIKQIGLQGNVEFDPLAKGMGAITRVMVLFGMTRDPTLMSPEDRILEKFGEKLSVLSPTKTRVLSVEFSARDPDLAARGANAIADVYLEMQQEAKRDLARAAAQSLSTLVSDLHARVAEAESKVEDYRAKTGLLIGSNNTIIPTQQLGELNNQLSTARANQADAQAKANLLRDMLRQNRVGDIPDVANNEVIRRIFEQRVALSAQLALESRTLLPQHPRIKELNAQLSHLEAQWRVAADRTARTLENEARIAAARVENLTRALDDQKRVAGAAGSEEVKLRDLERGARLLKDQLESETAKYQEALARERVKATPADARIIQRALAPQIPSFPKKMPITAFATLATLILSVGAVVAGELLSGRARALPSDARLDVAAEEAPAPAAPEQSERTSLLEGPRIDSASEATTCIKVLVTPIETDDRTTQTAIALARNLARRGQSLLIAVEPGASAVDAILAPGKGMSAGFAELMADAADFGDVIHRDAASRLHVMRGGNSIDAWVHDLASIVTALAHAYDFLIFAASPEQAEQLATHVDLAFVLGEDAACETLRARLAAHGAQAYLLESAESIDDLIAA